MHYANSETLVTTREDGVLTLCFNRPQSLNAFSVELLRALRQNLEVARADDHVRVVVLTGSGRAFSAGQDLAELGEAREFTIEEHMRQHYSPLILALADFPKPTLAAINGVAAGAGAGVALACDFKLMAEDARFLLAFAQMGLVLDSGTSYFLVRALGRTRALELALLGAPILANQAEALGLVNRVVSQGAMETQLSDWTRLLARGPSPSFSLIKAALRQAETHSLAEILELETAFQGKATASLDYRRALEAFLQKKPSPFAP